MEILISSFLGFLLGILSTFVIEKINELRKLSSAITILSFEIASNQEQMDTLRKLDLAKSTQDNVIFAPPLSDIYMYVKDELQLLPPYILQDITRYYLFIEGLNKDWVENLKKKSFRDVQLIQLLNALEDYSVSIMLHNFKPIVESRNLLTKLYYTRKLLLNPTWLKKSKGQFNWKRYEELEKEISLNKNKRKDFTPSIDKYRKPSYKRKK